MSASPSAADIDRVERQSEKRHKRTSRLVDSSRLLIDVPATGSVKVCDGAHDDITNQNTNVGDRDVSRVKENDVCRARF